MNKNAPTHGTNTPANPWHLAAVFLILYAMAFLIYGNSLRVPFYFDDLTNITENPHIRMTGLNVSEIKAIPRGQPPGRSLPFFTFALNYYFHRDGVEGYHLLNIFIHTGCGFLVFLLAGQTLRLCGRKSLLIPLLASLLWLTHPLHTQSVTYIVQRINSLAALFYLLTLWLYIQFRLAARKPIKNRPAFLHRIFAGLAALVCGILALLSKENTASLPLIILLYEWYFFQNSVLVWLKQKLPWVLAVVPVMIIIALVYLGADPIGSVLSPYNEQPFTPGQRLLSQSRVILYYISLLAFPHPARLNLDYDFPLSVTLTDPLTTVFGLAAVGAILLAAWKIRKDPVISFALCWFLVTLAVESSIIGLMLIFEHRTYLPSVFPLITLVFLMFRHIRPRVLATILLGAMIAVNGYWTFQRNTIWEAPLVFWHDNVQKSPAKARPHINYGMALAEAGDDDAAEKEYQQAVKLSGGTKATPYNNLGKIYFQRGETEKAIAAIHKAIQTDPDFFKPYMNLGSIMNLTGNNRQALEYLHQALRRNPDSPSLHVTLAKVYYEMDKPTRAIAHCRRALELDPLDISAENNLGAIFLGIGATEKSLTHLQRVLRLAPNHPEANINTGIAYYRLGNLPLAVFHMERAIFIAPEHAGARAEYGIVLLKEGRLAKAQEHLEQAVKLQPDLIKARLALADLFLDQRQRDPAAEQYRQILRYNPDNQTAQKRLSSLSGKAANDKTLIPPPHH